MDGLIRDAIRKHTRRYTPRDLVVAVVSAETGATERDVEDELLWMVADGEAVWRDPRRPRRIRSVAPRAAQPQEEPTLWKQ